MFNTSKDESAEGIAKLLLATESHYVVKPTITAIANWRSETSLESRQNNDRLRAAAFSSDSDDDEGGAIGIVVAIVEFVETVYDMLLERCNTISELARDIENCVSNAIVVCERPELVENVKQEITHLFLKVLQ